MQTKEDGRRMVQLLQFAEPIENQLKLFYDKRPEVTERQTTQSNFNYDAKNQYSSNSVSLKKCVDKSKAKNTTPSANRKTPSDARQNIVKTIMFPTETKENFATDENKCLKKQKEELIALCENIIMKMEEDGRLREEEFRLQKINMNQKLQELQRKNKKLEKLNYDITKNYMDLKFDIEINNKKLNDEYELAKLQNEALQNSLNDIVKKTNIEREVCKNELARKTREVTSSLRNQVKAKEENANLVKEQYKQIQKIYADKVCDLETKLRQISTKCRDLESMEGIQVENYVEEMKRLRKQIKDYENYVNQLKSMTKGNVDNYEEIKNKTMESNGLFFQQTRKTEEELNVLRKKLRHELMEYEKVAKGIKENNNNFNRSQNSMTQSHPQIKEDQPQEESQVNEEVYNQNEMEQREEEQHPYANGEEEGEYEGSNKDDYDLNEGEEEEMEPLDEPQGEEEEMH